MNYYAIEDSRRAVNSSVKYGSSLDKENLVHHRFLEIKCDINNACKLWIFVSAKESITTNLADV